MSSHAYSVTCPSCNGDLDVYQSNRPYPRIDVECLECGFYTITQANFNNLIGVNEEREYRGINKIKKLKEQNTSLL